MSRDLTANITSEVNGVQVQPILLVEMEFDSGDLRMWSGIGDLSWDSKTWLGTGNLGKISPLRETRDTQSEGITLELSGIPSEVLALALTDDYQYRPVTVWLGFLDSSLAVISDPVQVFAGLMDTMDIEENADNSRIVVAAESRLVDLLRPREWRYTHEDQQIDYPGDDGLEFVAALQDAEIKWGP